MTKTYVKCILKVHVKEIPTKQLTQVQYNRLWGNKRWA